jgi:hypothetical protein
MPAHACATRLTKPRPWSPRSWLTTLSCALATSALTACGSGTTRTDPPAPLPPIPPNLTALCDPLPLATGSILPLLWINHNQVAAAANDCALRFERLVRAVREKEALEQARYDRAVSQPPPPPKRTRWKFWRN